MRCFLLLFVLVLRAPFGVAQYSANLPIIVSIFNDCEPEECREYDYVLSNNLHIVAKTFSFGGDFPDLFYMAVYKNGFAEFWFPDLKSNWQNAKVGDRVIIDNNTILLEKQEKVDYVKKSEKKEKVEGMILRGAGDGPSLYF